MKILCAFNMKHKSSTETTSQKIKRIINLKTSLFANIIIIIFEYPIVLLKHKFCLCASRSE